MSIMPMIYAYGAAMGLIWFLVGYGIGRIDGRKAERDTTTHSAKEEGV